jgi:hypothetical protein
LDFGFSFLGEIFDKLKKKCGDFGEGLHNG